MAGALRRWNGTAWEYVLDGSPLNPVAMRRYRNSVLNHTTSNAFENMKYLTTDYDTTGSDVTVANGTHWTVTINVSGFLWKLEANVAFALNSTGRRGIVVTLNDATTPTGSSASIIAGDHRAAASAGATTLSCHTDRYLTAGDTLRVWVVQNSGSNLDVVPLDYGGSEFLLRKISS